MAQNSPLTSAAQNFFSQFNAAQERQRQRELIQVQQQKRQDIINAAELKRQQELDDREDLALSIESAIGIDTDDRPEGEQRGAGRVAGFVFNDKQRTAFSEAVANNPSVSGPILNFLSKANEFELQNESNRTGRLLRGGIFLQDQIKKSPVLFQEGIKQLVESGLYGENEVKELVSLSNEANPDLVNSALNLSASNLPVGSNSFNVPFIKSSYISNFNCAVITVSVTFGKNLCLVFSTSSGGIAAPVSDRVMA